MKEKVILALPTKYENVEIFVETIIGDFSSVNTRLAFDSQMLLPNLTDKTNLENNPMNKNFDYKVVYNLKLDNEKVKKRVITKILKLDENNQYGHAMTKPLSTGFIKDDKDISWETFNFLLESVSSEDKIGDLCIVEIEFDVKMRLKENMPTMKFIRQLLRDKKQLIHVKDQYFNYLNNLLEVKKVQKLIERLLKHMQIFSKKFFANVLEDLVFCIKRGGWKVTKIHSHLTFEQARFKHNFILMNQKSRHQ